MDPSLTPAPSEAQTWAPPNPNSIVTYSPVESRQKDESGTQTDILDEGQSLVGVLEGKSSIEPTSHEQASEFVVGTLVEVDTSETDHSSEDAATEVATDQETTETIALKNQITRELGNLKSGLDEFNGKSEQEINDRVHGLAEYARSLPTELMRVFQGAALSTAVDGSLVEYLYGSIIRPQLEASLGKDKGAIKIIDDIITGRRQDILRGRSSSGEARANLSDEIGKRFDVLSGAIPQDNVSARREAQLLLLGMGIGLSSNASRDDKLLSTERMLVQN